MYSYYLGLCASGFFSFTVLVVMSVLPSGLRPGCALLVGLHVYGFANSSGFE